MLLSLVSSRPDYLTGLGSERSSSVLVMATIAPGHCQEDPSESGEPAKVVDGWCPPCIPRDIPLLLMRAGGKASGACGRPNWCPGSGGRPPSSAQKARHSTAPRHVSVPSEFARSAVGVMSDRGCVRGASDAGVGEPNGAGSLSSTAMSARNSRGQSLRAWPVQKTGGQTPDVAAVGQHQCLMLLPLPRGERTRVRAGDDHGH